MTSILKCTFKISYSITKKIIKYGSIPLGIIGILALLGYGLWLMRDIILNLCDLYLEYSVFIGNVIYSIVTFIPWFIWIIIAIPVFIFGYSYGICIIRKYPDGEFAKFVKVYDDDIHEFIIPYCTFWGGIVGIILGIVLVNLWYVPMGLYDNIVISAVCSILLGVLCLFIGGSSGVIILAIIHIENEKEKRS